MRNWYVLTTAPRQETATAGLLTDWGHETLVPVQIVRAAKRKPQVTLPMFAGYCFAHMSPEDLTFTRRLEINGKRIIRSVVPQASGDRAPAIIDPDTIHELRKLSGMVVAAGEAAQFRKGQVVRCIKGPLAEWSVLIDEVMADRLKVLVNMFGRQTRTEVGLDQVEAA